MQPAAVNERASAPWDRDRWLSGALQALRLTAAFGLLSWCVSVRWPAPTALSAFVLPAVDVVILLALFVLFAPREGACVGRFAALGATGLVSVRLGRIADGVCERYLDRRFHVVADLPLIAELGRLARSSLGSFGFWLALAGLVLGGLMLWLLMAACLRVLARALRDRARGDLFLLSAAGAALLTAAHVPVVSASVMPRVAHELELWLQARGQLDDPAHAAQRRDFAARVEAGQRRLRAAPVELSRTGTPDVHVLLVEAYGHTVQATPAYRRWLAPSYQAFVAAVSGAGYAVCTSAVRATTFGGNSWLTHASLQTAVAVYDQFEYGLLVEQRPAASVARAFASAGYRTVSIKPGTTRPSPHTQMYGFEREYVARDFGYRGPSYAWSPMPDQFVLQHIAQRELAQPARPLFLEYALVTSHFPWTPQPPYVPGGQNLGDGSLYRSQPVLEFDQPEGELSPQALGYLHSLGYELRVIADYLTQHVRPNALVLVLGDHQPIAPVAREDRSRATPLHVLSRRRELLDPLAAIGCTPGMLAARDEPALGMEDVGVALLRLLSGVAPEAGNP